MIGFYTFASPMTERQLLNSAPKPVSMFDSRIHLRFDLDNPPGRVPQHFTNIHAGLRLARSHLLRQSAANKQIIVITDGEPTAHIEGREVVLIYPPAEKTATHTLPEVRRCASAGIRVSSFALIEDYFYLGLVNFVEEMARVSQRRRRVLLGRRPGQVRLRELHRREAHAAVSGVRASSTFGIVEQFLQPRRELGRKSIQPALIDEADVDEVEQVDLVLATE